LVIPLLFGFSRVEIKIKIKEYIVSFHNFGEPNPTFIIFKIISIRIIMFGYTFLKVYMSLLFGFSGIEIGRKIKSFIVSFHNFGKPKPTFIIFK
jgi:hypothetical protein